MVAFKKMICCLPRESAPRPTSQRQSQHLVEPISDDEFDYEDTCFTPDLELQLELIPLSDLSHQIGEVFEIR